MLRTALKPRWLGLLAVLAAVLVSFTWLGLWQLNVAKDEGRAAALEQVHDRPVAELASVLQPHAAFPTDGSGRRVRATGTYAADGQFLVASRRLQGRDGYWVVAPLVERATGARLAVVRGFVEEPELAAAPSAVEVTVTGSLAPGESPADPPAEAGRGRAYPLGTMGSIDLAVLVNQWPGEIYNAFAFAVDEQLAGGTPMALTPGLQRVPPPEAHVGGLKWRNTAYALQWWIFAAFAAYMWFRMVRDDAEQDKAARGAAEREKTA